MFENTKPGKYVYSFAHLLYFNLYFEIEMPSMRNQYTASLLSDNIGSLHAVSTANFIGLRD